MSDYSYHPKKHGHTLRRLIHLSIALLPIIFYWYILPLTNHLQLPINVLIMIGLIIIIILELVRLTLGILLPGQRHYEINRPSGFAWGSIGVAAVFLFTPKLGHQNAALGLPLIWSWVFADPVLGEMRRLGFNKLQALCAGAVVISAVWGISALWLGTPYWIMPMIVPITLFAEWIKIPYIDDNFTMLVAPLVFILIIETT